VVTGWMTDKVTVESYTPQALNLTDFAVEKIQSLADGNCLRVHVTGGGCSGFEYGFAYDDAIEEDDTVITKNGVTLVVDSLSIMYLMGSTVDYEVGLMGSRFLIDNPLATTTCGCGASFSI